jgi:heme oxygenase
MRPVSTDQITEASRILLKRNRSDYALPIAGARAEFPYVPISSSLKNDLAVIHAELEQLMQIPERIKTVGDYLACLEMYFGIFQPLEELLATRSGWVALGIDFDERRRTPALVADIAALGGVTIPAAIQQPRKLLPFAEALGAFYVLEGSTLGGRLILRALERTLGAGLSGATRFFEGHGARTASQWVAFKQVLDFYGEQHKDEYEMILRGAINCFDVFRKAAKKNFL